ncbi:MAG: hypothetical protein A2603_03920 [Bdellovibrionales bacterium RIFOXYD1_FULL_55_31]|nr:MAG: hypothetical protein A2603_03920 [Bdellovibrionales bacterium RIFOXYD1_FULL_55_31]
MIEFMMNNLGHLIPIILCGLVAISIFLERTVSLYMRYPLGTAKFLEKIRSLADQDRLNEGISFCERYENKPVARVVKEGLMRAHQPQEIVEHGLLVAAGIELDRIKARTPYLSMIANVSTLLGLIGTILGLIQSFEAVSSANPQARSALLAQGISTAMNHTLWGLSVAVPCMVIFSFLMNRTNRMKSEIDRTVIRTLEILRQRDIIVSDPDYVPPATPAKRRVI